MTVAEGGPEGAAPSRVAVVPLLLLEKEEIRLLANPPASHSLVYKTQVLSKPHFHPPLPWAGSP